MKVKHPAQSWASLPHSELLWYISWEVRTSISFILAWILELVLVPADTRILGGEGYIIFPESLKHTIATTFLS